jgi:actin-related protein 2
MVGRPLQGAGSSCLPDGAEPKDVYVGAEAAAHKQRLDISYPISNGVVENWEDMGLVWNHCFSNVLGVDPSQGGCYIMLTEPPLNPKANRQRMFENMFEKYGFEAAYVQVQAVLTLYSLGALTGLVLDSGDGVTHAVPVVDGYSSQHLTGRLNVAGRHITAYLADLLTRRGYSFNRSADCDTVRQIKERLCFMAYDLEQEIKLVRDTTCTTESYTLPDGRTITIGPERFTAPEALINPSLLGVEAPGMAEMVHNCIQNGDIHNRLLLYSNIVLRCGGQYLATQVDSVRV